LVLSYTYLTGDVLTDPSLPVTNVQARRNQFTFGYEYTFGLAGHSASIAFAMPYTSGNLSGNVVDAPTEIHRAGIGDLHMHLAFNLLGGPALSPEEFAHRTPSTSLGLGLTISAPTGQYSPARLVNIGTDRWAFKPEIGISQPWWGSGSSRRLLVPGFSRPTTISSMGTGGRRILLRLFNCMEDTPSARVSGLPPT
jgi:hypothetical protein